MIHYGRGKGSPSKLWSDTFKDLNIKMNPKSMTPKTDMYIGDMRISLKQTGGSQLMSGYAGDTAGVITAAYNKAIKNNKIENKIEFENTDADSLGNIRLVLFEPGFCVKTQK